jgi:TIR domain
VGPPPPDPRPFHVFLNYRREDTAGYAGRLYDALARRFGDQNVFMDIDRIGPGEDFTKAVEQGVGSCDVLLALIGRDWVTATDREGRRRLDKPNDWVRVEIQTALDRSDTLVIPTLVQGVEMPASDELPAPLQKLSHRNAIELSDSRWHYDVERLIKHLEGLAGTRAASSVPEVAAPTAAAPRRRPRWLVPALAAAALILLGVIGAAVLLAGDDESAGGGEERYVGLIDARLDESADEKADLNVLITKIRAGDISRPAALDQIGGVIRQREDLLDDLSVEPPELFRDTHEQLRESIATSLADDEAIERWIPAWYAGTPNERELWSEVARLSTLATSQKDAFLDNYNALRQQELGLAPERPNY